MPVETTAAPVAAEPTVEKTEGAAPKKGEAEMGKLLKLLNKISPGMARKIAEKGAKKMGMDYKTAGYVGKAVEKGVEKKHSQDKAAAAPGEGAPAAPTPAPGA